MVAQVEKLTKENMMAQNEVTDIRKKFSKAFYGCIVHQEAKLIENIINRGTKSVLNDLKNITDETQFDENTDIPNPTAG